jgi:hypothetical protein
MPRRGAHGEVWRSLTHFGNEPLGASQVAIGNGELRNTSGDEC